MSRPGTADLAAFASGLLFGAGLVISQMTRPSKVLGFLDFAKDWDPSLLFVMGGGVAVHALAYLWKRRRVAPFAASSFAVPPNRVADGSVIVGAVIFGVGWGLSGYCPGPALMALATRAPGPWLFFGALLLGSWLATRFRAPVQAPPDLVK